MRRYLIGAIVLGGAIALSLWFARDPAWDAPLPPVSSAPPTTEAASVAAPLVSGRSPVSDEVPQERPAESTVATSEDPFGVVVTVRDWRGEPFPAARVLVADRELMSRASIATLVDIHDDRPFVFDGTTGDDGCARFRYRPQTTYHLRVEGPDGLPGRPSPAFIAPAVGTVHLRVALGRWFGAAFRLQDGSEALYSLCELEAREGTPQSHPAHAFAVTRRHADRLGIPERQVFVDIPRDGSLEVIESRVKVYHARIGWFEASLPWMPLDRLEPTVIPIPESGVSPPVRLTFECVDLHERPLDIADIFVVGSEAKGGFPPLGQRFASGKPGLTPPGRYVIHFGGSLRDKACTGPRTLDIAADTSVRLSFQWAVVDTTLLLTRLGRPYQGPARVSIATDGVKAGTAEQRRTAIEGRILCSLRADRSNTISVTIRGVTREVTFLPGGAPAECHLVF